ncbi:hypothetical protein TNCV_1892301 [Trichonephila clavipes]|nr:hypothetical protein TNCV_1892301 [Trichonephila clavipes]
MSASSVFAKRSILLSAGDDNSNDCGTKQVCSRLVRMFGLFRYWYVALFSYLWAFGDGPCNFEPWSSKEARYAT